MTITMGETGQIMRFNAKLFKNIKSQIKEMYGDFEIARHWHNRHLLFLRRDLGGVMQTIACVDCTSKQAVKYADYIMSY